MSSLIQRETGLSKAISLNRLGSHWSFCHSLTLSCSMWGQSSPIIRLTAPYSQGLTLPSYGVSLRYDYPDDCFQMVLVSIFLIHKYYIMLNFIVLLFGSWMQLVHFNVLLHVPVISYEWRTICKCIPVFVMFTLGHIVLLVVAFLPSIGCKCKTDAVYRKSNLFWFFSSAFHRSLLS